MRRTRSRKTHKHHAKRRTRRRGGMNAPGGKPGAERPAPRPGVNTNQGPANRPVPPHAHLIEPMPFYQLPRNKYFRPLSYFPNAKNKNKNKGFKPVPMLALPGSAAALAAANAPGGVAPLARQAAEPKPKNLSAMFPLPGSAAALNLYGPVGAPLARQPAEPKKSKESKVAPLPSSPFSPTSGY